jgi:hypothetical protein
MCPLAAAPVADLIDNANQLVEEHLQRSLRAARAPIPAGVPGECADCDEDMPRLIDGRCGFCRDGRRR